MTLRPLGSSRVFSCGGVLLFYSTAVSNFRIKLCPNGQVIACCHSKTNPTHMSDNIIAQALKRIFPRPESGTVLKSHMRLHVAKSFNIVSTALSTSARAADQVMRLQWSVKMASIVCQCAAQFASTRVRRSQISPTQAAPSCILWSSAAGHYSSVLLHSCLWTQRVSQSVSYSALDSGKCGGMLLVFVPVRSDCMKTKFNRLVIRHWIICGKCAAYN